MVKIGHSSGTLPSYFNKTIYHLNINLLKEISHDGTNMQDATTAPEWAMELIRRISQLEAQRNPVSDLNEADIDVDSDIYNVKKLPSRDLLMYPELPESLPELSQDFFKSPITDLERRKFLESCPRNSEMDPNCLNTANAIEFAGLMRTLLSYLASQVTQLGMDGAYKASKIPGKAPQIISSSSKPLFDQKEFVEHIGASQALAKAVSSTKSHNKKGFTSQSNTSPKPNKITVGIVGTLAAALLSKGGVGRNQSRWETESLPQVMGKTNKQPLGQVGYRGGISDSSIGPTTDSSQKRSKIESTSFRPRKSGRHRERNNKYAGKKGYRADFASKTRLFLSNVYDTQKIRRVEASSKSEAVKQRPTQNTLPNGKFKYSLQNGKEKGLDDKHRFIRCFSPCSNRKIPQKTPELHLELTKLSIPSAAVWTIPESTGVHERRVGNKDKIGYEEAREFGLLNKFRKIELNLITINSSSGDEDKFTTYELRDTKRKCQGPSKRSGPPDKAQENKHQKPSFFPRESSSYGSGPLAWSIDDKKTVRAKKFIAIKDQEFELRNTINNSSTGELSVWKEFGNKCKRIASDHICPETTSKTRSECIGTFRQQNLNSICEETRRNAIPKLTKSFGGTMDTLYSNRNETSTELRTVNTEPSRRAIKADISNRMVAIQEDVQHNREEVRTTRCRHVCESKNSQLDKYVTWKPSPGSIMTNIFNHVWRIWNLPYCCPPWNLIQKIIQKVRREKSRVTQVTTGWKTGIWYPDLIQMSISKPIKISTTEIIPDPSSGK
ncbi:hypothetical protein AYI70_g9942 [Smittium culicis]|uniref:Uncharacterized protein n=1 Tax=Smittium culicis TaxID=133412 RepID=A0A1R1X8X6_9FUNG|nr:hypothetical protein AYI70_g9942 [Smittium culicis]